MRQVGGPLDVVGGAGGDFPADNLICAAASSSPSRSIIRFLRRSAGAVTATVNGKKELLSIKLLEDIVDPEDIETLQDSIMAAVNEALKQAEEASSQAMNKLTGGLGGLGGMPF